MEETITAIYGHGVLRPLRPLELPEHARVEITIRAQGQVAEQRRKIEMALQAAGLLAAAPTLAPSRSSLSPERREELARRFGQGKPVSEIVIEDR